MKLVDEVKAGAATGALAAAAGMSVQESEEDAMGFDGEARRGYATWQKVVLAGCTFLALAGTVGLVMGLVPASAAIAEYGGSIGAPVVMAFVLTLLSLWLFAGSAALLVYIARTAGEISEILRASIPSS